MPLSYKQDFKPEYTLVVDQARLRQNEKDAKIQVISVAILVVTITIFVVFANIYLMSIN